MCVFWTQKTHTIELCLYIVLKNRLWRPSRRVALSTPLRRADQDSKKTHAQVEDQETSDTYIYEDAQAANKRSLKSDLKRSTAFVKKVRAGIADEQSRPRRVPELSTIFQTKPWSREKRRRASLLQDVATLNLERYVDELVAALAETRKTKDKDCAAAGAVCSALHRRHAG